MPSQHIKINAESAHYKFEHQLTWWGAPHCLLGRSAELERLCEGGDDGRPALVGILLLEGVGLLVALGKVGHGLVQRLRGKKGDEVLLMVACLLAHSPP